MVRGGDSDDIASPSDSLTTRVSGSVGGRFTSLNGVDGSFDSSPHAGLIARGMALKERVVGDGQDGVGQKGSGKNLGKHFEGLLVCLKVLGCNRCYTFGLDG